MGLGLTIMAAGDNDLARFQAQLRVLEPLLTGPNLPDDRPACSLNGYWLEIGWLGPIILPHVSKIHPREQKEEAR